MINMRCLCCAKFLSNGSVAPDEFFSHLGAKWTCIENTAKDLRKTIPGKPARNSSLHESIVFITDCKTLKQLTLAVATMPGAGISSIEVFPMPEIECQ